MPSVLSLQNISSISQCFSIIGTVNPYEDEDLALFHCPISTTYILPSCCHLCVVKFCLVQYSAIWLLWKTYSLLSYKTEYDFPHLIHIFCFPWIDICLCFYLFCCCFFCTPHTPQLSTFPLNTLQTYQIFCQFCLLLPFSQELSDLFPSGPFSKLTACLTF